jgi:hypothetical protein
MNKPDQPHRSELSADAVCIFLVALSGNFLFDAPPDQDLPRIVSVVWSLGIGIWMAFGAGLLKRAQWIRSYGADQGISWLFKDALAMLIWPFLLKWILNSRKSQP